MIHPIVNHNPKELPKIEIGGFSKDVVYLTEIFESIQGEGTYAGHRRTFIRFASCSVGCSWCDTDYAPRYTLSPQEVVQQLNPRLDGVVITGGEPTDQSEALEALCIELKREGFFVELETSAANDISEMCYAHIDHITISPKSVERLPAAHAYGGHMRWIGALKFIATSYWKVERILQVLELFPTVEVYVQPLETNGEYDWERAIDMVEVIEGLYSNQNKRVRMSVQIHKLMGKR